MDYTAHLENLKRDLIEREFQKKESYNKLLSLKGMPEYNIEYGKYDALCSMCEDLKVEIYLTEKHIASSNN